MRTTEPGVYSIPADEYHRDPVEGGSLSSSGARKLLPPSCPALFKYEQDNPPEPTHDFDIGHAAHKLVLGDGPTLVGVGYDDWRSKAAREERDQIRVEGAVPLLKCDYDRVHQMSEVVARHPIASALFDPDHGKPEQTLVWQDEQTGVWLRARLDWLPNPSDGRLIVTDYKSARSAHPQEFARSAATYGYYIQAAFYLDGVKALGLDDDPAFLFVVQDKNAPYLVSVVELDSLALDLGRQRMRRAIDTYQQCRETGHWPGFSDDIELVSLPRWVEYQNEQEAA